MAEKSPVKLNKKHGGKEFKGRFHYVGKVKPFKKQDANKSWFDVPYFEQKNTKNGQGNPRRSVVFTLETAEKNDLKIEVAGMEQKFAYPYSQKHKKSFTIDWANRLDKTKFPDDTYHIINETEWDRAKTIGDAIQTDQWVEVRGSFEFSSFNDDTTGAEKTSIKRTVEQFTIIENGSEISLDRNNKITYTTDFNSPDFIEVNNINMQLGIKSTYQDDETKDTSVKAVFLSNGKDRSEPNDVELTVYYKEVAEGMPLANAFASLNRLDFIEIMGQDNNRATFAYVDIEEKLDDNDPFNEVSSNDKTVRQEKVVNGSKKGLEITGYVSGTILRNFLTEEEIAKAFSTSSDPFASQPADPFAVEINPEELPF